MNLPTLVLLLILSLPWQENAFFVIECSAYQISNLDRLIQSRKNQNPAHLEPWPDELDAAVETLSPVYISPQDGLKEADKVDALPGQPVGVDFNQYAGYVTVDPEAGRALFYYFVESPQNSSSKPLLLWLNGGPGCSSFGYGAMQELGPFRVKNDNKTLYHNDYSWNKVANVLFLESPVGVGFSRSNSSDYFQWGDKNTAADSYTFLINWFKRFPEYKNHEFYITGESYAGHYVPQLAYNILALNSKRNNETLINLRGIAIGNAYIDHNYNVKGMFDYFWTHALNSDEVHASIDKFCDYRTGNYSSICLEDQLIGFQELGSAGFLNNLYAPVCKPNKPFNCIKEFDPCSGLYVTSYLNLDEVQRALHARPFTTWALCRRQFTWADSPKTILPLIKQLISSGIRLWLYSGDVDVKVPVTGTRYCINSLNLSTEAAWRPWYSDQEVGGYVVGYKGLVFVTVRGAGHEVPSDQPERALTMISSFLQGTLPPPLNDSITY